jgi:hypothetical protein
VWEGEDPFPKPLMYVCMYEYIAFIVGFLWTIAIYMFIYINIYA